MIDGETDLISCLLLIGSQIIFLICNIKIKNCDIFVCVMNQLFITFVEYNLSPETNKLTNKNSHWSKILTVDIKEGNWGKDISNIQQSFANTRRHLKGHVHPYNQRGYLFTKSFHTFFEYFHFKTDSVWRQGRRDYANV